MRWMSQRIDSSALDLVENAHDNLKMGFVLKRQAVQNDRFNYVSKNSFKSIRPGRKGVEQHENGVCS